MSEVSHEQAPHQASADQGQGSMDVRVVLSEDDQNSKQTPGKDGTSNSNSTNMKTSMRSALFSKVLRIVMTSSALISGFTMSVFVEAPISPKVSDGMTALFAVTTAITICSELLALVLAARLELELWSVLIHCDPQHQRRESDAFMQKNAGQFSLAARLAFQIGVPAFALDVALVAWHRFDDNVLAATLTTVVVGLTLTYLLWRILQGCCVQSGSKDKVEEEHSQKPHNP